mmetsp:Transcript_38579/g.92323  ORF Transcript_38579/g.92323 Transcript_38579/m.92323 type:complete len:223 (+) Transcript_38579:262-930(+)
MAPLPKYIFCLCFTMSLCAFGLLFVGPPCQFLKFTSTPGDVSLNFGLYNFQGFQAGDSNSTSAAAYTDHCQLYPDTVHVDGTWKAARVFNGIAIILGGSILMIDIFSGCLSMKRGKSFMLGVVIYAICCLCTGLSFMVLNSALCKNNSVVEEINEAGGIQFGDSCKISMGGKSTIASCVLYFTCAIATLLIHPRKSEEKSSAAGLDEPFFNQDGTPNSTAVI